MNEFVGDLVRTWIMFIKTKRRSYRTQTRMMERVDAELGWGAKYMVAVSCCAMQSGQNPPRGQGVAPGGC